MASQTEGKYVSDWLKHEADALRSREAMIILAGSGSARKLTTGMVLGKSTKGAAAATADGGNTGDGTMGGITVGAAAKPGKYRLTIIEPGANAGVFQVEDPDGINVGTGTVAVAFSGGGLDFTLADGGVDFIAGDGFDIDVAAGTGKWEQLNLTGTDGSEDAAGLLYLDAEAPDGTDGKGVAIVRDANISDNGITWPGGASAGQKTAALAQLKLLGILVREGA